MRKAKRQFSLILGLKFIDKLITYVRHEQNKIIINEKIYTKGYSTWNIYVKINQRYNWFTYGYCKIFITICWIYVRSNIIIEILLLRYRCVLGELTLRNCKNIFFNEISICSFWMWNPRMSVRWLFEPKGRHCQNFKLFSLSSPAKKVR